MKITGLMINYYFVCKRKLWYNSRNINLEEDNENVQMGKLIDENSYNLETKQIMIEETVNIDFIRHWKVIHEVKKSKSIEEAAIWQVKYYIYFLKQRGIDIEKGIIDYPVVKERKEVFLTSEDEKILKDILKDIEMHKLEQEYNLCNRKVPRKHVLEQTRKLHCCRNHYRSLNQVYTSIQVRGIFFFFLQV